MPLCRELFQALLREEGFPHDPDTVAAVVAQGTLDVGAGLAALYGAFLRFREAPGPGRLVGCIQCATTIDAVIGWHHVLTRLYVEPLHRHEGIGMRLIRAAVAGLDRDEDRLVITTRRDLPRSYRKLGARPMVLTSHATVGEVKAALARGKRKAG